MGMIGIEDRLAPGEALLVGQPHVSRYFGRLAQRRDRGGHLRIAIAVDHEPRIVLRHQWRIERRGDPGRYRQCADVPGDVPF